MSDVIFAQTSLTSLQKKEKVSINLEGYARALIVTDSIRAHLYGLPSPSLLQIKIGADEMLKSA